MANYYHKKSKNKVFPLRVFIKTKFFIVPLHIFKE